MLRLLQYCTSSGNTGLDWGLVGRWAERNDGKLLISNLHGCHSNTEPRNTNKWENT